MGGLTLPVPPPSNPMHKCNANLATSTPTTPVTTTTITTTITEVIQMTANTQSKNKSAEKIHKKMKEICQSHLASGEQRDEWGYGE